MLAFWTSRFVWGLVFEHKSDQIGLGRQSIRQPGLKRYRQSPHAMARRRFFLVGLCGLVLTSSHR